MATKKTKAKATQVVNEENAVTVPSAPVFIPKSTISRIGIRVTAYEANKPYCCHAMSQKALLQLEQGQDGVTKTRKKEPKDQYAEFIGAGYWIRDDKGEIKHLCAPAIQFKKATVDAVRHVGDKKTLTMKAVRSWFHIRSTVPAHPDMIPLESDPLPEALFDDMDHRFLGREPKESRSRWVTDERTKEMKRLHKMGVSISRHPAKVGMGMDLRYRPKIYNWSATLEVEFDPQFISQDGLVNLINIGGRLNGIGEWRPSSPQACGDWGMFKCDLA